MAHFGPTIAFILGSLHGNYQSTLWQSFERAAGRAGMGSVWFPGLPLNSPYGFDKQHNVILRLLCQGTPSGVLAAGGALTGFATDELYRQFIACFRKVPFVSLSIPVPGETSIVLDNSQCLDDLVGHLVDVHHSRRIAFLRGPVGHWEADERYHGFVQALKRRRIGFDADLELRGNFHADEAARAVEAFLDQGKERFDALVCANDEMAIGACQALARRGIAVPESVKVTGFDDIFESSVAKVPLTTIQQPLSEQIEQALACLRRESRAGRGRVHVSAGHRLVIRKSCGCFETVPSLDLAMSAKWTPSLTQALALYRENPSAGARKAFLVEWENACEKWVAERLNVASMFFLFAREAGSLSEPLVDSLLWEASLLGSEVERRILWRQKRWEDDQKAQLQVAINTILLNQDFSSLSTCLAVVLPSLGLRTFYLSLYDGPVRLRDERPFEPLPDSHLVLAVEDGSLRPLVGGGIRFRSGELVPKSLFDVWGAHGRTFMVLPLFLRDEHYGFALVEFLVRSEVLYETLRTTISSAFKIISSLEDQKRAAESFRELSTVDELTGLTNRRGFLAASREYRHLALRSQRAFLVLFIDLDGLKEINDRWGHSQGDWAIQEVARILKEVFRKADLVARMGGDEFTVFAFDVDYSHLPSIRDRLESRLQASNAHGGKPFSLSLSLGAAPDREAGDSTLEELLLKADKNLYADKMRRKQGTHV